MKNHYLLLPALQAWCNMKFWIIEGTSWPRLAQWFIHFLARGGFSFQSASFSGSFGSVKNEHSVILCLWQDTAGSVKLWEITRGFMVADYGQVGLMVLTLSNNWYGGSKFPFLLIINWVKAADCCPRTLLRWSFFVDNVPSRSMILFSKDFVYFVFLWCLRFPLRRRRRNCLRWYLPSP